MKTFKGKSRKDEVILGRLRLGQTGLKPTLYLMTKCVSDKCNGCNVPENVEHVILWCNKYSAERIILRDKMYGLKRGWNLEGILGRNEKMRDCCKALFLFLRNTGLDQKI